jgi:RNA recognition motif-containing protein
MWFVSDATPRLRCNHNTTPPKTSTREEELMDAFEQFVDGQDRDKLLIAGKNIKRGFAFVDLGSQAAVARAVTASRMNGIQMGEKKLVVEPSKKPVRQSGLKAMNDRRGGPNPNGKPSSNSSSAGGRAGRGSGGVRLTA